LASFASVLVACSSGDESGGRRDNGRSNNPFSNGTGGKGMTTIPGGQQQQQPGGQAGIGPSGSGGDQGVKVGDLDGCTGSSVTAPPASNPKVDIVWVVDASGSMLDEQKRIGENLAQFADAITAANIDVHIVMMTQSASIPVICPDIPQDPLAGSKLDGDPRYMFLQSNVDSHNVLDVVTDSYPQYKDFLRADAVTHLVTVTDDESTYKGLGTSEERATTFKADFSALLGKDFVQHTISSEGPTPCLDPMCMPDPNSGICVFVMLGCGASAPGATYYALAEQTNGLESSICIHDWTTIFEPLTAAVIESAPLPCNYAIPPPPQGESLDPTLVNVGFIPPGAGTDAQEILPKAATLDACGSDVAWYYDSPAAPTQVLLCPAACTHVASGGTLNVAFGCATVTVD
jgi:hypothetical protein